MRVFQNIGEAISEIRRDVFKSPLVHSSRVQHMTKEAVAHEATNYAYTILDFPETAHEWVAHGVRENIYSAVDFDTMVDWLHEEERIRLAWWPGAINEKAHPQLALVLEGNEPSYTYTDRLHGAVMSLSALLEKSPDSRRGFWPIFQPEDAKRSVRDTRIPCSIGYQVFIREVNGIPTLHLTYIQRSCDLDHFWMSDVWLARQFQRYLLKYLCNQLEPDHGPTPPIVLGSFSHIVLSLHSFVEGEIY